MNALAPDLKSSGARVTRLLGHAWLLDGNTLTGIADDFLYKVRCGVYGDPAMLSCVTSGLWLNLSGFQLPHL